MKNFIFYTFVFALAIGQFGCGNSDETKKERHSELNDNEIRIGSYIWLTRNLNVDTFQNGDPIPHAQSSKDWYEAGLNKQPAWCYYQNNPANGPKFGKLYNWFAVNDKRGLAPKGWKIPSDEEWVEFTNQLGGAVLAGKKTRRKEDWIKRPNGNNESGFTALPAGCRYFNMNAEFSEPDEITTFWSSTGDGNGDTSRKAAFDQTIGWYRGDFERGFGYKGNGNSVRCLKK